MKSYLGLVPQYLHKQFKRSILTVIAIILSVTLIMCIGTINESIKYEMINHEKNLHGDFHVYFENLDSYQIENLLRDTRIDKVATILSLGNNELANKSLYIQIEGYDSQAYEMMNRNLISGEYPIQENEIVLEQWILEEMGFDLDIGQTIPLSFGVSYIEEGQNIHHYEGKSNFILVGIMENNILSKPQGISKGFVGHDTVKKLLPKEFIMHTTKTFVKIKDGLSVVKTIEKIQENIGINDKLVGINEALLKLLGESKKPNYALVMLVLIIIIASVAIIYNIFYISVLERVRQFGMLRTIGASSKHIRKIVLGEALILSIIAIPCGLLVGGFMAKLLMGVISSLTTFQLVSTVISLNLVLMTAVISLISVFISALSPAMLASKVAPLEALRNNSIVFKNKSLSRRKWHRVIQKLLGAIGGMAYRNLWRNKKKSIITIFSICLGVVLFIIFGFYTDNLNKSNKMEDYIFGDYKILVENNSNYDIGYSDEEYNTINNLDGVKEVFRTQYTNKMFTMFTDNTISETLKGIFSIFKDPDTDIYNTATNLFGYTNDMLEISKKCLIEGTIDIENMSKENIVLVSDHIRAIGADSYVETGLKVGDEIVVRELIKDANGLISYGEEKN